MSAEREIVIERELAAPPERVWRALTDPEQLVRWWARGGNELRIERLELEPAGRWRFVEHADGETHGFGGTFHHVDPPRAFTWTFAWDGAPEQVMEEAVTLHALDGGARTRLVSRSTLASVQERELMLRRGWPDGKERAYAKLDALLAAPAAERRVVVKIHVSLDGFVGAPDGNVDWAFETFDDELRAWEVEGLRRAGVHVMGRVLYADMAAHWPTSDEPYAAPMNDTPKVVFSKTLNNAPWGETRIDRGDLAPGIAALKAEEPGGGDILVHGGARLLQALGREGLVDEYRLLVHPVALGAGLPLFAQRADLTLQHARRFPAGALALTYVCG